MAKKFYSVLLLRQNKTKKLKILWIPSSPLSVCMWEQKGKSSYKNESCEYPSSFGLHFQHKRVSKTRSSAMVVPLQKSLGLAHEMQQS